MVHSPSVFPFPGLKRAAMALAVCAAALASVPARADAVDLLRDFARDVKSGRAQFSQTVISPDGKKRKESSGTFEFTRPNRFRFAYVKPFEQAIVADGQKVWIYDADLNQVSSRKINQALGATPAAVLAGGNLDADFTMKEAGAPKDLKALKLDEGLSWIEAVPKNVDKENGSFQSFHIAFKGKELAAMEILDNFGQRSVLRFSQVAVNPVLPPELFKFTVPPGADLLEQ
jgi:outer membrane lipoprotein carrier protein